MKRSAPLLSVMASLLFVIVIAFINTLPACGGGSGCDGTTFVNDSGETVIVSANANSGIQFSTFELSAGT